MRDMTEAVTATQAIIRKAGGPRHLHKEHGIGGGEGTIYNWYHDGIPKKYWEQIAELAGVSVIDVFNADKAVREAA